MDRLWSDESLRGPVRSKSEWAGISMADAFKDLDFGLRLVAQRLFFDTAHKIQRTVARLAGVRVDAGFKSAVPVQVSPSHTTYPPTVAVFASLGLTAFLELEARVKPKLLVTELASYLGSPGRFDRATSDPAIYAKVAKIVAETVQTRLLIEDLSRHRHLGTVEVYRLFAASQQAREFRTLGDIVRAVVLYSDLWGGREPEEMHRMTRRIYEDLDRTSTPYLARLASSQSDAFSRVGQGWVKALCRCLDKYLPLPRPAEPPHQEPRSAPEQLREWLDSFKFGRPDEKPPGPPPETIPGARPARAGPRAEPPQP